MTALNSRPEARQAARFRAVIGLATLVMLALSWPLWVAGGDFPRVPFVLGLPPVPATVSWVAFGALLGLKASAVTPRPPR